jgi:CubicO group peptidase (beta-lactamase class C family)
VTLADLATHTSGLPRLPPGLWWSALGHLRDPYAGYSEARLIRAARRSLRASSRPNAYAYSNYGYGLLGYLLGQAAGSPYQALVTERICAPLGLADTTFEVPPAARDRMAQGHARGQAVPGWHLARWPPPVACTRQRPTWPRCCASAWPDQPEHRWTRPSGKPYGPVPTSRPDRSAWPGTSPSAATASSSGTTA